jgi:hypothetical protein
MNSFSRGWDENGFDFTSFDPPWRDSKRQPEQTSFQNQSFQNHGGFQNHGSFQNLGNFQNHGNFQNQNHSGLNQGMQGMQDWREMKQFQFKVQHLMEENQKLRDLIDQQTRLNLELQAETVGIRSGASQNLQSISQLDGAVPELRQVYEMLVSLKQDLNSFNSFNSVKLEKRVKKTVHGLYYPVYISLFLIFLIFILLIVHMSMRKTIQV